MFRVYQNVVSCIKHRKALPETADISEAKFIESLGENGYFMVSGLRSSHAYLPDSKMIFLIFAEGSNKISKKGEFETLWNSLPLDGVNNVVLIAMNTPSHYIAESIRVKSALHKNINIEICETSTFLFDFSKAAACVPHKIAKESEVEKYCKENYRDKETFKKYMASDSAVIWVGARRGDVIKIKLPSANSGYAIDYRIVV